MIAAWMLALVGELTPRVASWSEAGARVFDPAWLPAEPLWSARDEERALVNELGALCAWRAPNAVTPAWAASFGDMLRELHARGATREAFAALSAELRASRVEPPPRLLDALAGLGCASALGTRGWNGATDEPDDGLYAGAPLRRRDFPSEPWRSLQGARSLHQVAAFVRADLDALLAALHDYPAAARDPGTSYERLEARAHTFVRGADGPRGAYAALRVRVRSDLPFPFSHYDCDIAVLHVLNGSGVLENHVYGIGADFYWLAGSDACLPVTCADGTWIGTLVVRVSGCDLRGVPDDDDSRSAGTRVALGNLKRRAEALYAPRAAAGPRTTRGAIPEFVVRTR